GNGIVDRHTSMAMPALDDTGKDDGEINFAELLKVRLGAAEHAHDFAALIENLHKRDYLDAFDHAGSPRKCGAGRGTANRPPRFTMPSRNRSNSSFTCATRRAKLRQVST